MKQRTYWYQGVMYLITEEEYQDLVNGWVNPKDMFG